jgi:peptidyl-prolyl cis-trans isomerase A (cyclophilin A)
VEEIEQMTLSNLFRVTIGFLISSCLTLGASAQTAPTSQAPAPKPKSTTASKPASAPSPYDRALLKPALLKDTAPDTYRVKFVTTRGDFTVTVHRDWAPHGADRFYNLVKHHYYDGARIYRVIPNFVAQSGISAYPPVNAAWAKATIKDDPVAQKNLRGTLTFAKTSAPDSRTTELFFNFKDNSGLDAQGFAPFAVVDDKGMNIVEMFYDQYPDPASAGEQPNMEKGGEKYISSKFPKLDVIKSATIVGAPASAVPARPAATGKPKS